MRDASPHGYRISVRELVEDARRLGTWRPLGEYDPKPGDLAISARDQGDPTKGGSGHVERVEVTEADRVINRIGLTSDETVWCAAAASHCCFAALT